MQKTNFASGLPLSCVSIGLCINGQPEMGVVFAPMTQELYIAVRSYGAFRNGIRLLDCTGEKKSKTLSDAVVCFEFGYSSTQDGIDRMINAVKRLLRHGLRTTRTLGSGVLDLCYVACGRMDVVYTGMAEEGWKVSDIVVMYDSQFRLMKTNVMVFNTAMGLLCGIGCCH